MSGSRHLWDWDGEQQRLLEENPELAQAGQMLLSLAGAFLRPPDAKRGPAVVELAEEELAPAPTAVLGLDARGHVTGYGQAAREIFGHSPAQVLGRPLSLLLHASDGEPCALREGRLEFASGVRGRRRTGELFPVQLSLDTLALDGQEVLVVACQDLTRRLEREETNRKARARYQMLVEQIPAVTFLAALDEGDNEIYIGPQIEQLLGFTQEEWLSNPVLWYDQLHPDDRAMWNKEFARGCQTGGPFRSECRLFARDGTLKWVHGEARVVRDEQGQPLFLQGIAFDITERKLAEQKTREAQEALARNERLTALGQLAGAVAHDLRNPLGAIRNAWFFVRKKADVDAVGTRHPRVHQLANLIDGELERCAKIIGELLDFARTREPYRVASSLSDLVASALTVVARPSEQIALHTEFDPHLPIVYVDTGQLRQVLVNLIQNALEAVDPETGRVEVRAGVQGDVVRLEVEDDGCGIPADMRERILEPLFTTKQKGTGLGLSIVNGVIQRHGGTVKVRSEVGRGTCFELSFPVGAPSEARAPQEGGAADLRP